MTEPNNPDSSSAPAAPTAPSPAAKPVPKRRFGGTPAQILSALKFYKVLAYATGAMLLLLVVELVFRYGFQSVLVAGGTDTAGASHGLGLVSLEGGVMAITGGVNLSTMVLIVHGWMYVVYLIADFRLWTHKDVLSELAAHPHAGKRY